MRRRILVTGAAAAFGLVCVCVLAINLAAASGMFGYADEPVHLALPGGFGRPGPEVAARQHNEAISAKDLARATALTCRESRDIYADPATRSVLMSTSRELIGVRYETARVDGDTAEVREIGRVKVTLGGLTAMEDVNNAIPMRREGGQWKYCPPKTR
jgi:hypothetical protein